MKYITSYIGNIFDWFWPAASNSMVGTIYKEVFYDNNCADHQYFTNINYNWYLITDEQKIGSTVSDD